MDNEVKKLDTEEQRLDTVALVLSIFFPPVGVFLKEGVSGQLFLNILLTLFGYVPGIVHALYIVLRK
jgi:uncharacterized membrane protein YqaE (UPF0057 family)